MFLIPGWPQKVVWFRLCPLACQPRARPPREAGGQFWFDQTVIREHIIHIMIH